MSLESIAGDYLWVIALGLAFALAMVITVIVKGKTSTFFANFLILLGIMAYGNIIEYWIFILVFILFLIYCGFKINDNQHQGA